MSLKMKSAWLCLLTIVLGFALAHSQPSLNGPRRRPSHRHREPHALPHTATPRPVRLLVLVLAGGHKPAYYVHRAFWRMLAERVRPLGVQIYLISTLPGIQEPLVDKDTIHFPDNDPTGTVDAYNYSRYVSMSVDRYVEMMRYVYEKRPHGHDAPYILRSTLASFWCFSKLLHWLDGMPSGNFGAGPFVYHDGLQYLSGAAFLLSADVAKNVHIRSHELNRSECDDIALGRQLHKMGVQMAPVARMDVYTHPVNVLPTNFANDTDFLHWRVKSEPTTDQGSLQDAGIWASMFFYHYGPTMEMRHGTSPEHEGTCA